MSAPMIVRSYELGGDYSVDYHAPHFTSEEPMNVTGFAKTLPVVLFLSLAAAGDPPASQPASPEVLPGNGLAQHNFLYAGEWDTRKDVQSIFIIRDGKISWSYEIPTNDSNKVLQELSDATMLSNGNIVFARKTGAGEVTPDKKLIWNYDAPKGFEVHVVQPLGLDRVMYIQNGNPAKMVIYNVTTGKTEKEMELPTGNPKSTHGQFRRARITKAGTLLAAHMDNNKVAEYDMDGKVIWSVAVPSPWAANRLDNGNTLISSNKGFVREVDPAGKTVWELTKSDVPGYALYSLQEADRLANGNTVITNWCPNALKDKKLWATSAQMIEVTPDKKVVWALRAWEAPADLGPATVFQSLDEPGVPENQGQPR